ncbi:MAG: histidine--tRNA ligase [Bacteroidota bacterium]
MAKVENKRGVVARKVKGFRDIDPSLNQLKWKIINAASEVYRKYGFEHWDTPVLEYADCLGKYLPDEDTVDKGVYSFKNPEEEPVLRSDGSELRDDNAHVIMENAYLSLRYDLTSPLARRYAEGLLEKYQRHMLKQMKPPLFRRYQYGPVYRYEIKLSPGRFREFWQLDFDNVGTNDVAADAEVCMVLSDALEAIGLPRKSYVVKVNNRKILTGYLKSMGVERDVEEQNIIRVIDKMDKIGLYNVALELGAGREDSSGAKVKGLNLNQNLVSGVINFIQDFMTQKTRQEVLADLKNMDIQNDTAQEGIQELEKIDRILSALDFDEERVIFDPSLVRGLAYYTGPVYEVESLQTYIDTKGVERRIGSICGGGRYDGLVENLLGIKVPATGASIGVDRLAELLVLTNQAPKEKDGPVFIAYFDEELVPHYQKVARTLRMAGIETEVYYGMDRKKMKKQMAYADDKNCPFVILIGGNEAEKGVATVKNLKLGKELANKFTDKKEWMERVQKEVPIEELADYLKKEMST